MSFLKQFFFFNYIKDPKIMERLLAVKIQRKIIDSNTCIYTQAQLIDKKLN